MWSHVAAQTRASPQPSVATAVTDILHTGCRRQGHRLRHPGPDITMVQGGKQASHICPVLHCLLLPRSASLPHPVTYLFTITVPDPLAPQGSLRASFPHPGQTALGWRMCVCLCLLGPCGAKPNVYLLLLPNYRYNTTNASLSCQRDGL